jgi:hypothetical protein
MSPLADWAGDIQRPEGGGPQSPSRAQPRRRLHSSVHTDVRDMKLSWLRRSKIIVEVLDDEILVTMPGTSFSVVYEKTTNNRLIASSFSGRKVQNERSMVSFPHFLSLAWTAANEKAKEIGWIVSGRAK